MPDCKVCGHPRDKHLSLSQAGAVNCTATVWTARKVDATCDCTGYRAGK